MSIFSTEFWTKSNRKPITPINYDPNQDLSWVKPLSYGLLLGVVLLLLAL
jgi:hypothetical protein